jgi:hypothetical protein
MKNIQNWEKFNESYNQEMINEGVIGDLIKLPFKIVGFLLKPLVPLLLKIIGKTITVENKWKVIKAVLDNVAKLALDIEEAKKKLSKENSDLTPNERRELENKVEKFKKKYPNGFKFSDIKKKTIESVEQKFAKATDEKKKEDLEWLLKKISEYKISKPSASRYNVEILDDSIVESLNEGRTDKALKSKDSDVKKDSFRDKIKNIIESNKDCKTKKVGNDLEIHCCEEHVAQVMFRDDYVGVKKLSNKFPKEFGYNELGKIKAELSSIIKSNESQSNQKSIFTYTLLNKDEEVVDIEASNMDEAGEKVVELYPGSDPMLTHVNGKLIDWKRSNF